MSAGTNPGPEPEPTANDWDKPLSAPLAHDSLVMSEVRKLYEQDRTAKLFSLADMQDIIRAAGFANKAEAEIFLRHWDRMADRMLLVAERHRQRQDPGPDMRDPLTIAANQAAKNGHKLHKEWTTPSTTTANWTHMNQCDQCGRFITVYTDGSVGGKAAAETCGNTIPATPEKG